ncbi:transcription antitermination factor NusB [Sulfuricurvum sp. RIFCSPLOWO2_12_FULL_43_24]|jgi:transcription antitermination protein NusB|uniref:transcription antitermination factor NusB n=1 Tax=Sulfuricurvum sp. RIFCSPLOWO2_12_FULL_43_24 TaxID=1802247 RepID=UPI0008B90E63|nr:transcription antitermination factor NusB [Sulfuricurvum sp. RIFCSPLOWO2_12_FULL_43_24]OHD83328.1 MAG: N utilization substance protein B [Sulfuricurvum sp. RIFCSPHIGHO2_02_FULL_43_9]OHD83899.1 MAG: N utilization substance protein B [Sulfuricurvum sp. RIFCSPHIGHO2_12_FULL_44_8]OHD87481.1 MAG: N utilization substance protein B [Sulfuricurvum sp. RIFCSPLOWO2_02_43_6]OHD88894.1 MAG: N utilization substance protein B [Sulfuricurvum sp. RIFCSPLOWO2_12_FULL_43_24]
MATRHQARMAVVSLLYAYDLGNQSIADFSDEILEEKKIRNKQRDFALDLFKGVTEHLAEVDEAIVKHLKDWDFDRLGSIERATLRLGGYEIMYGELDSAVIINEAIEVAKAFGSEQSPKFINGVLDAISRDK